MGIYVGGFIFQLIVTVILLPNEKISQYRLWGGWRVLFFTELIYWGYLSNDGWEWCGDCRRLFCYKLFYGFVFCRKLRLPRFFNGEVSGWLYFLIHCYCYFICPLKKLAMTAVGGVASAFNLLFDFCNYMIIYH